MLIHTIIRFFFVFFFPFFIAVFALMISCFAVLFEQLLGSSLRVHGQTPCHFVLGQRLIVLGKDVIVCCFVHHVVGDH